MNSVVKWTALAALPLMACASYPAPTDHLANSYANISAAEAVGAQATPEAALYLRLAQEEQAKAKELVAEGKNADADFMSLRANSDAELAVAFARETIAKQRAMHASSAEASAAANAASIPTGIPSFSATTTTTSTTVPANSNPPSGPSQ